MSCYTFATTNAFHFGTKSFIFRLLADPLPIIFQFVPQVRLLKSQFHIQKKRLKPWKKRNRAKKRNLVLSLLACENATIRRLSDRTGLKAQTIVRALTGQGPGVTADTAQRIARGIGVSTDLFLDVLRVYMGWPNNRKSKPALKADCPSIAERLEEEKR